MCVLYVFVCCVLGFVGDGYCWYDAFAFVCCDLLCCGCGVSVCAVLIVLLWFV